MAQNTVFSQVIKPIPQTIFQGFVNRHNGDFKVRTLDCWTWFGSLLFSQLTGHDSIRALERVFTNGNKLMKKLDFGEVRRSTLADANKNHPLEILYDVLGYLFEKTKMIAPEKPGFKFKGKVFSLDSTTIKLCLNLCPWAVFHHGKGAFKLHTAIDLAGN